MNWTDHVSYLEIFLPAAFNFEECLVFLGRSALEVLHQIKDKEIYKLLKVDQELLLMKIGSKGQSITVEFLVGVPSQHAREEVATYLWEWFDLGTDLKGFYEQARNDSILKHIAHQYHGLRMICIPDLFEALTWAIIGQQINLTFAYTLKKRLVEQYGERLVFEGNTYWLYPDYQTIASLEVQDLRELQFTTRKAEYVIEVARAMAKGELSKENLLEKQDDDIVRETLLAIRGVGAWTADYVMMKCFHHPAAFPIADVGLHQAIMKQLGLDRKPTLEEIKQLAVHWEGWQAYATFYLWRSLYE